MRKRFTLPLIAIAAVVLPVLFAGPASAHGYSSSPPARSQLCAQGVVKNCGPIQYEPQSVEGPKGFPGSGPADGRICAGGLGQFAQLDDPRGGSWPAAKLTSGASYTFTWHFTARHATSSFRYFVTRNGWDPSRPLTRAALESTPFLNVPWGGKQPTGDVSLSGKLPSGKSGRHLILAVWDIADTGNAFYSCADVTF
ncbi:lytic polysaccharide monooxygenase [Kutzneria viridogrisea]|uniref:Chitin-binding protein n=2 Tax=Kutzneria TaxID=43356 RepID=A0ABR6BJV7_9PSEU|nr:lytic polysaccharide monooxygenase [Kutzneria albida]AHH95463.1 putative secreted chitin-binding protein [Kutzneria albida DSM 43870]MBA8927178.1 chitin-binding protein [Kutzneria viridogrisea]